MPFMDLSETDDSLIIKAEVPGIQPEDIDISITGSILTIKGERRHMESMEEEDYHRMERRYGSFSRTLELPCKILVDDVKATYDKGVLSIVMPKCKADAVREIKVRVT